MLKSSDEILRPLWVPSPEAVASANLTKFTQSLEAKFSVRFPDYKDLYQWSVKNPTLFWPEVVSFCDVLFHSSATHALVDENKMPGAKWFVGATLNFAENLLRRRDASPAIIAFAENGATTELSFAELYNRVAALASWMRAHGVAEGDRIAAIMPNIAETVVAMLATTSLGAIWSSCSPDFGAPAIVDRFSQISPKLLFVANGYHYNGKLYLLAEKIKEVLLKLPSVQHVVMSNYVVGPELKNVPNIHSIEKLLTLRDSKEFIFEAFPFDHPIYILYSSGTTGSPKCIVHGAGGTLLQHVKEQVLHTDLMADERIFYATTCGWMMWNWLVSALATGATIVLYDGSPFFPTAARLFDIAEHAKLSVFGTSAKYLSAAEKAGVKPITTHQLATLRCILSTGSPLLPESFDYVYRDVKNELCLSSISGGTDIVSCFALGNPTRPVFRGELQSLGLGMDVAVFDEKGQPVAGKPGELVCLKPFPSMPVYFWNDPTGEKFRSSYFEKYPGVWRHGDWAERTAHDGLIIYGRSDATLNPGGVRIGTAELYQEVEAFPEILESVAVGQEWEGDVRIILFVRMQQKYVLNDTLRTSIAASIRKNCSPRHVPAKIIAVNDIPRTMSGKIVELAIRNAIHNRPVENMAAIANPDALRYFENIAELKLP